jgi:hypothetical protein
MSTGREIEAVSEQYHARALSAYRCSFYLNVVVADLDAARKLMKQLRSLGEEIRTLQQKLDEAEGIVKQPAYLSQEHWKAAAPNAALSESATLLRRK